MKVFKMLKKPAPSFHPAEDGIDIGLWNESWVQQVTDKGELKQMLLFDSCNMTVPLSFQFILHKYFTWFSTAVCPETCKPLEMWNFV